MPVKDYFIIQSCPSKRLRPKSKVDKGFRISQTGGKKRFSSRTAAAIFPAVRVLGVDFGRKKIGLALSDPLGMAHPLGTEKVTGLHNTVEMILEVAKAKEVSLVVLGYPLKPDGSVGDIALEVEKLAELLKKEGLSVVLLDERFSSERAIRSLHIMGKKKGKNKRDIDTMAAALLLQEYLDRKSRERNG